MAVSCQSTGTHHDTLPLNMGSLVKFCGVMKWWSHLSLNHQKDAGHSQLHQHQKEQYDIKL